MSDACRSKQQHLQILCTLPVSHKGLHYDRATGHTWVNLSDTVIYTQSDIDVATEPLKAEIDRLEKGITLALEELRQYPNWNEDTIERLESLLTNPDTECAE